MQIEFILSYLKDGWTNRWTMAQKIKVTHSCERSEFSEISMAQIVLMMHFIIKMTFYNKHLL